MNDNAAALARRLIRNFNDASLEHETRAPLYDSRCARLASGTAALKLGASIDIVAPGKRSCPYHFHHAQEEMFVIVEAQGSLRVAGEMLPLRAGDVIFIPAGSDYPHQIVNTSDAPLKYLSIGTREQRSAAYLAVNPMGKVPAIGDPLRGPSLRWMVFYGSCFEPALVDRAQEHAPAPATQGLSPYGDYETVLNTVNDQLARGPYLLGERFTAADVLRGSALAWASMFKLIPDTPVIKAYIARIASRPSFARARARNAELLAARKPA